MVKCKLVELTTKIFFFVEHSIFFFSEKKIEFCWSSFQKNTNLSILDQEKQKIQQFYIWNPINDYWINYVNIDLGHRYGVQTFLLAKCPLMLGCAVILKQPVGNNSHPNLVVVVEWRDGGEGAGFFIFWNIPNLTTAS